MLYITNKNVSGNNEGEWLEYTFSGKEFQAATGKEERVYQKEEFRLAEVWRNLWVQSHQNSGSVLVSSSPEVSLLSFLVGTRLARVKEEKEEKEKVSISAWFPRGAQWVPQLQEWKAFICVRNKSFLLDKCLMCPYKMIYPCQNSLLV